MVQNGKFSAGIETLHTALKNEDFPTFGRPTTAIFTWLPGSQQAHTVSACGRHATHASATRTRTPQKNRLGLLFFLATALLALAHGSRVFCVDK